MKPSATTKVLFLLLACGVPAVSNAGSPGADTRPEAAESGGADVIAVSDKAARKISMAIGEEMGDFVVTAREDVESAAGSDATQYTVRTSGGRNYKCQIIEPSRAGKIFSFGTAAGADALCTEFSESNDSKSRRDDVQGGKGGGSGASAGPTAAIAISDKAAKKISMAIGEDTDRFVVTRQEGIESPAGMKGTEYTVRTGSGKTYKCQILEPSKLGKLVSFGTAGGANALCTDFTRGSKSQGKTNQASCNALLRAAHKCD